MCVYKRKVYIARLAEEITDEHLIFGIRLAGRQTIQGRDDEPARIASDNNDHFACAVIHRGASR